MNKKINIDVARFVVSFLVIAIHISPFININQEFNFFFTRILGRIAVPLFFMITGYFVIDGCLKDKNKLKKYTIKILKIYLFCIILYLPINIYMGKFNNISIFSIIKDILINGTLYHLWYFPALILGIWITYYFIKKLGNRKTFITVIVLYIIGLLGDSYYGLTRNVCVLSYIYDFIFKISDYTRNGLFYAPIFLYLGYFIKIKRVNNKKSFLYSVLFFIGMTIEATILHKFNLQKHDSMYILLIPTMYVLFDYLINISNTQNLKLRNVSTIIYIFHPLFIVGIRFISGICKVEKYIVDNNFIFYLVVAVVTTIFAFLIEKIKEVIKMNKENSLLTDRAWVEVNLENLEHNINEIKKVIQPKTKIMAVVKANAYGHGSILIAEKLSEIGINDFAVATLDEAIELRKHNIKGNILILGYTNFEDLKYVIQYDLIQTIVDYNYSEKIKELKLSQKLNCHIKINTGMNRIGERYDNMDRLIKIYENPRLNILGTFSHLCVADSDKKEDIEFTEKQIENFNKCIKQLKENGQDVGKVHLQSSYGAINYNTETYDYVRIGIIMYGVNSDNTAYQKNKLDLKPVLSLKARVTSVKEINKDDSVSYGRTYIADSNRKIASISIGYADGFPRCLSNKNMLVKVNGNYSKVIGRICMDQCVIDVTDVKEIKTGDVVYIIDCDDINLSSEKFAMNADTITNEFLSGLGNRLPRIRS